MHQSRIPVHMRKTRATSLGGKQSIVMAKQALLKAHIFLQCIFFLAMCAKTNGDKLE